MTMRRRGRFGIGAVLSMAFVAGLAVAAFTSHPGEVRADDHQLELVSVEAEGGTTQSSIDQTDAAHVASTALDEDATPKVKSKSCSRAK